MAFGKIYELINWVNERAPSLSATNLNKMDTAINTLDDRVVDLDKRVEDNGTNIENLQTRMETNETLCDKAWTTDNLTISVKDGVATITIL